MAEPNFYQPERRNLALPITLALVLLAAAAFLILRFTPHTTADIAVLQSDIYAAHTVFKSDSMVVGRDQAQDDLYVLVHLRITDHLRLPLFLKDFTATLLPASDTTDDLALIASALEKQDVPTLYATFPAIARLPLARTVPLLLRETRINPGETAQGLILLHFSTTQAVWQNRQSASLTIDLYHQPAITVTIPKPGVPTPDPSATTSKRP